jgi:hypothetical protein
MAMIEAVLESSRSSSRANLVTHLARVLSSRWMIATVFLAVAIPFYCTHNDFAFYYHPDESSKVEQVIGNWSNYNHPLLLLTVTRFVTQFRGDPAELTPQTVVLAGRLASATFAAIAVAALALLAREMAGAIAGWTVGFISLCNPLLYELAHFMKEDVALTMGLCLCFLSFQIFWQRRTPMALALVGISCAVAVSGKYVGYFILLVALPLVLLTPSDRLGAIWARIKILAAAFVITWAILNATAFENPFQVVKKFGGEARVAVEGHKGLTQDLPHAYYLHAYGRNTPPFISLLAITYFLMLASRARKTSPIEWIIVGYPLLFFAILSFVPKSETRYLLPISAMVFFCAGMGAATLARLTSGIAKSGNNAVAFTVCSLCLAIAVTQSQGAIVAKNEGFSHPDHARLRQWIEETLPATAIIAQDARVNLPLRDSWKYRGEKFLAQKVIAREFAADLGSLEGLKRYGVTHIAIAQSMYLRFLQTFRPVDRVRNDYLRRRQFYATVRGQGRLVWSSPRGAAEFLQPGLELYDITQLPLISPSRD